MLKAAIIGFGSISRAHRKEYLKLEAEGKVKLTCAYDVDPEAFARVVKNNLENPSKALPENLRYYTDLDEMLAKEELSVLGRELYCSSFSAGAVTVEGLIGGVLYRRMRRELLGEGRGAQ